MLRNVLEDVADETLAARAREDELAFSELYSRYLDPVYRFMRYQAPDDEAKDLTAQVFFQAYRAASQFRGDGATYRAWLFRIAHNTLASWRRSRHRMPVPVPELPDEGREDEGVRRADEVDVRAALWSAVDELAPAERELIELRYVEGLTPREIAHVTGGSDGAVRVRMHRLLKRLKTRMEQLGVME